MKAPKQLLSTSAALCAFLSLAANNASAQNQYFNTVANGGTYSWDGLNWNASPASANTGPYTSSWAPGNFARFYNGAGDNYTVTVNAAESMSGMFLNAGTGVTLNINDAGGGTGSLSVVANAAQVTQNGFSWLTQGFLTGGGTLNLNASIGGAGGVEEESGGGNINLYGANTFTGGFLATSSSTFIGFNNNASFGAATSQIGFDGTTFAIMNNTGSSSVNIANPVQAIGATGVNFIGNSVTMSGNWFLGGGSSAINLRNNGVAGTTVTLSGVLSGTSGNVTFSGANGGAFLLGAQNTYTGNTVIGSSGATAITVQAGVANAIAGNLVMAGGKFSAGGFNQTMGTLGMTASSTFSFGAPGNTTISFTGATPTWTAGAILNISDWQGNDVADGGTSTDTFRIGTSASGATAAELADIEVNGNAATLGGVTLDANGYLEVLPTPEPSTLAVGALGIGMIAFRVFKRRKA
jgi:hypothetical protein